MLAVEKSGCSSCDHVGKIQGASNLLAGFKLCSRAESTAVELIESRPIMWYEIISELSWKRVRVAHASLPGFHQNSIISLLTPDEAQLVGLEHRQWKYRLFTIRQITLHLFLHGPSLLIYTVVKIAKLCLCLKPVSDYVTPDHKSVQWMHWGVKCWLD